MGEKLRPKEEPFKEKLKPSTVDHRTYAVFLQELENRQDKIIRHINLKKLCSYYGIPINKEKMTKEQINALFVEASIAAKKFFDELKENDIYLAVNWMVGMSPKGEPALYAIADKIDGIKSFSWSLEDLTLEEMRRISIEADELYGNLIRYIVNKFQKKERFLWDIARLGQYIWGKRQGEGESHWYLVDVDPQFVSSFNPSDIKIKSDSLISNSLAGLEIYLRSMDESLLQLREEFKCDFPLARVESQRALKVFMGTEFYPEASVYLDQISRA